MKTYILIIIILFTTLNKNYSQVFFRKKKESVEVFVNRIINKEQGDLKFHIIETAEWSNSKKVIIYFIGDESLIIGYLLTPINDSIYKQTFVDYFGGKAATFEVEILNVFFANTDIDNQNEIVITSKLRSKSPRFSHNSVQGYYYDNNIYDNPNLTNPLDSLEINKRLTERFSQGFEGSIYNRKNGKLLRKEKAKNKEEKFIRQMLKKMGYKQGQQPT